MRTKSSYGITSNGIDMIEKIQVDGAAFTHMLDGRTLNHLKRHRLVAFEGRTVFLTEAGEAYACGLQDGAGGL